MRVRPKVIDSTLREGSQAPGVHFGISESVEIAEALCALGVDMIECGHPLVGDYEKERVRRVVSACRSVQVMAHARARADDVDAVKSSGAGWVGIFVGVNPISLQSRFNSHHGVHDLIASAIGHAKRIGLRVRFTVEDGTRTQFSTLVAAFRVAVDAGADRICFADTVGALTPWQTEEAITNLRRTFPEVEVEGHFHDDRGLAEANALSAVRAGAGWVSTSVNGLGERCGITDTVTFLANLHAEGLRNLPDGGLLQRASLLVRAHSRMQPDTRRPVVGKDAFTHTSKLHRQAVERNAEAYAWIRPESLGRQQSFSPAVVPLTERKLVNRPAVVSSLELPYHGHGPGERYLMIDDRVVDDARQYCIVRRIPVMSDYGPGHVERHRHTVDSLFLFLGDEENLSGLSVQVDLGGATFTVNSPSSIFIPSGVQHSYRVLSGSGKFVNYVLAGTYNSSLLEVPEEFPSIGEPLRTFLADRRVSSVPSPEMLVRDVFDSLMLLDLFVHFETLFGDRISLDEVAECRTFGELSALLASLDSCAA